MLWKLLRALTGRTPPSVVGAGGQAAPAGAAPTGAGSGVQVVYWGRGRFRLVLPPGFEHSVDGDGTLVVFPPGGDAVCLRLTLNRFIDHPEMPDDLAETIVRKGVDNSGLPVQKIGGKVCVLEERPFRGDDGTDFALSHYQIGFGRAVAVMTVGVVRAKADAPEVAVMNDALPRIIESMRLRV